jgi:hypothetical protein
VVVREAGSQDNSCDSVGRSPSGEVEVAALGTMDMDAVPADVVRPDSWEDGHNMSRMSWNVDSWDRRSGTAEAWDEDRASGEIPPLNPHSLSASVEDAEVAI